jgi:LPXTG-motif cell wall-anchored protein
MRFTLASLIGIAVAVSGGRRALSTLLRRNIGMRHRTIGYFGAIVLAMAPMMFAQEPTPVPEPPLEEAPAARITIQERHIEGEVVEVNAQMLTVRTEEGRRMAFSVDRDLTAGAEPITVGSRVRVEYRGEQQLEVVNVSLLTLDNDPDDNGDNGGVEAARVETTTTRTQPAAAPAASQRDELPATASPLPVLLAVGLALLGSGLGLSSRRRA